MSALQERDSDTESWFSHSGSGLEGKGGRNLSSRAHSNSTALVQIRHTNVHYLNGPDNHKSKKIQYMHMCNT